MKEYKIGVVGGSGYIGSMLANELSKRFQVRVIDKVPIPAYLQGRVEYKECNLLNFEKTDQALNGLDLVIHTAIIQIPLITEKKRLGYEVNLLGTQNVCKSVDESTSIKGMILSGTWHVFGERKLQGTIDESFGFRPDHVEERARLYALSKIAQEVIMRFHDEMSEKTFGIIRMGTVLGEGMPEKTAAKIFIQQALKGEAMTPFKHSMYRPMLYVDLNDVARAFEMYATRILTGKNQKEVNSLSHIVNLYWPEPITIIDLAHIIKEKVIKQTDGKIRPRIRVVDEGKPLLFTPGDKKKIKVNLDNLYKLLGLRDLQDPRNSLEEITKAMIRKIS
jgi:nucleoside-diphosphate-sugar epimerase